MKILTSPYNNEKEIGVRKINYAINVPRTTWVHHICSEPLTSIGLPRLWKLYTKLKIDQHSELAQRPQGYAVRVIAVLINKLN